VKSSLHSLIPLLPLFCNCQLNSIPSSQARILVGSRLETPLTSLNGVNWTLLYNYFARTTQKTHLYYLEGVFTAPLHSNWSYSIVACVFVAAGMCLPSRTLAMDIYSDVTIPALGRHVTVSWLRYIYHVQLCMMVRLASVWRKVSDRPRFMIPFVNSLLEEIWVDVKSSLKEEISFARNNLISSRHR
jgi:hypothetical protein